MYNYYRVTPDQIQNYVYCGGNFDYHKNYFKLVFPECELPPTIYMCACERKIIKNGYIRPKDCYDVNSIIRIGSCCIKHFISSGLKRTCQLCGDVHQNRKDNYCNHCRENAYNKCTCGKNKKIKYDSCFKCRYAGYNI